MTDFPVEPVPDEDEPIFHMEPRARSPLFPESTRQREAISRILDRGSEDEAAADADDKQAGAARPRPAYREVDPLFAYLFLISLAIGLSTFDPTIRYLTLWMLMSGLGVMAYLLGAVERMGEAQIEDLVWGIAFGFLSSFPFLLVFGSALETVSARMFDVNDTPAKVMDSWVFMAVAFVLPASETLFFRGAMQGVRGILFTTALSTLWAGIVFFPYMSLAGREVIGMLLVIVFSLLNFMYSYVRFRNGLAGAWLCQIVSYTMLWFFPRLLF